MSASVADASTKRHPPGLYLLFTAEMWERMSYYGMRALLPLYLVDRVRGGLGWSDEQALGLFGTYTGLVYLSPLLGGYLADQYVGQKRSILLGGTLMMIGQFLLAMPGITFLYAGLAALIVGNGFFKPNASTMVGGLYKQGDSRRDAAFTIFYMGINIGALLASFVCGTLGERVSWGMGFASAGIGMALGLTVFWTLAPRYLSHVGNPPRATKEAAHGADHDTSSSTPLTREERDRILVILIISAFVILFWTGFEQAGGLMNLYTDRKVDRVVSGWTVPTTWFQSLNSWFIVILGVPFAALWTWLGRKGKDPSIPTKMAFGLILLAVGFAFMLGAAKESEMTGKASLLWIAAAYLFHTMGELCLSPVGLSMVTKLAPKRYASMLMGTWFLASAIANKLAGVIGGKAGKLGEFAIFGGIAAVAALGGLVLLALSGTLKRMMHGADALTPASEDGDHTGGISMANAEKSLS